MEVHQPCEGDDVLVVSTDLSDDPDRAATESGRVFVMRTAHFVAGRAVAATARGTCSPHRECRGDAEDDRDAPGADDDELCRGRFLAELLDESEEWSALLGGLPEGDAAENSLHESLMPRWDIELDRQWPAIAAAADLLLHNGEVDGNTIRQLVRPAPDDQV